MRRPPCFTENTGFNAPKGGNAVLTEIKQDAKNLLKCFNAPKGGNAVLTREIVDYGFYERFVSMPRRAVMLF